MSRPAVRRHSALPHAMRAVCAITIVLCTTPGWAGVIEIGSARVEPAATLAPLGGRQLPAARQLARWALTAQRGMFTPARMPHLFAGYPQLESALRSEEALTAFVRRHPKFYDDVALALHRAAPELTARFFNDVDEASRVIRGIEALQREQGRREAAQLTHGLYERALQRLEAQGIGPGHPDLEARLEAAIASELQASKGQLAEPSWNVSLENDRLTVSGRIGPLFRWKGSVTLKKLAALIASGGVGAAELGFFEDEQLKLDPGPPPIGGPYGRDDHRVIAAAVARRIDDREPRDTGTVFTVDVERLYAWSRIGRVDQWGDRPTRVEHRWYRDGRQVSNVYLTVGSSSWRTWSMVRISGNAVGDWRVDILSPHGEVMETLRFKVVEP